MRPRVLNPHQRQSKPARPPRELTPEEQLLQLIQAELRRNQGEHKFAAYLKGSCTLSVEGDEAIFAFLPFAVDFHKGKVEEQLDAVSRRRSVKVRGAANDGSLQRGRRKRPTRRVRWWLRRSDSERRSLDDAKAKERRMAKARGGMFRQSKKGRSAAGGGGGVNADMIRQAQELQTKIQEAQAEIKESSVDASAGGGADHSAVGRRSQAACRVH